MFHPKEILESRVICDYINGKTRNQIAIDNNTSTGNVSNITSEWKRRIGKSDGEEIRDFVKRFRKSGLSVKQCADGYRTAQLMKKLGILSEDENDQDNSEEFTAFVKGTYLNCKDAGIDPPILVKWIRNLFDCFSVSMDNNNDNNRSFSFATNRHNEEEDDYNEEGQADMPQYQHQRLQSGYGEPSDCLQPNETNWTKNPNWLSYTNSLNRERSGDSSDSNPYSANRVKIPFISQVSGFIAQRKRECIELKKYKTHLESETKRAQAQRNHVNENLAKTIKKESHAMHYFEWFYKLKQELWDNYAIRIEDIERFAKVINDFKNHNYDPYEIIKEYSCLESVRQELTAKKSELELLEHQERRLNGHIVSLEARLSFDKQITDAFYQLNAMGFGLLGLKQISKAILEISSHRNITPNEATDMFLKDIEKNCFDKVLFEDRVKEGKAELEKMKQEFPNYRYNLQLESYIKPTLIHLFQNGVTNEDIITINKIFTDFANNRFFLDPQIESGKNITDNDQTKPRDRIKDWRIFIDKLKKLGDINSAIRAQKAKLIEMEQQVSDLRHQKQELDSHHKTTQSILYHKDAQISYLNGLLNHLFKHIDKKIRESFRLYTLNVNIIYIKSGKDDKQPT